jgi:DDE superfamily endonuclease
MGITAGLGDDLERWLAPFLEVVGRKTRRAWAPLYVQGLLGPEGRRSVQPMAARLGLSSHDQLHHFLTSAAWNDAPLWRVLAETVDRLVGGPGAVLVIDDTALPKRRCRRRANSRSAWRGSTAGPWASRPTVRCWSLPPWPAARCRRRWACGCFCPRPGSMIPTAVPGLACRRASGGSEANRRSPWPRLTGCGRGCASAPSWPMPGSA